MRWATSTMSRASTTPITAAARTHDVLGEDRLAEQVLEHPAGEQADGDAPHEPRRRLDLQQPSQKLHERSSSKGGPGFGRLVGYAHR